MGGKAAGLNDVVPRDPAAEQRLIGAALVDAAVVPGAARMGVRVESFTEVPWRRVWVAMVALVDAGQELSEASVLTHLTAGSEADRAGDAAMARALLELSSTTTLGWQLVAGKLVQLERARARLRAAWDLVEATAAGDWDRVDACHEAITRTLKVGIDTLPAIVSAEEMCAEPEGEPPELVKGVLHQGAKLMLGGGSKSFKTWCLLDLAISVATGKPWWGMATVKAPVLYCNFELAPWSFRKRIGKVKVAKEVQKCPDLMVWNLRGHAADIAELVPQFITQTAGQKIGLIVLDPIYKCLGERDENANGEVADLLNQVEAVAVRTGAAIAFGHHFSKGNQAEKESRDRVSGAGAWARDPDALITLTPHEEEGAFVVDFTLRNHEPKKSTVVRWKAPCMEVSPGLDPSALKRAGRPKVAGLDDVVAVLSELGMTSSEFERECKAALGLSETTFKRKLAEAQQAGLIVKSGMLWKRVKQ